MWTKEQEKAINESGLNIIVSAGAGSGKTAVLSERVIKKLEQGININELLILTFTKAAAGEMKERIRKKISKLPHLKEQLDKIDSSYITTFDSYALSLVKKYHYLLNVSKNISIAPEGVINIKKNKFLEDIFNKYYALEDKEFLNFIDTFCVKDDKEIFNYILELSSKTDMIMDKEEYLKNYMDNKFNPDNIKSDINKYIDLIKNKIDNIKYLLQDIRNYVSSDYYEKLEKCLTYLFNSNTYDEISNCLNVRLPSLREESEEAKKIKEEISSTIKEIKSLCTYESYDEIYNSILSTSSTVKIIIKLLLELDEMINTYKNEYDVYEFNDIEMMAINLLRTNHDIKEEVKDGFKEILLDEYQDTNDIQEEFISLISNNNVYMVGDIKQSIYRFRNANPYIFKNKYDNYSQNNGGLKIDLNKNFRSRKEVIENINTIFNLVMDDEVGGADYISSHQMVFGNTSYINEGSTKENYNLDIYNYLYDKDEEYSKDEIEAFIIAKDIKDKINNKFKVFDKDDKIVRDIKYSDIVILLDRSTNFDLFKKVFIYNNIPINLYKDEKMINDMDIITIKNLLSLILKINNNTLDKEFEYLYVSITRSFLYKLTDEEIYNIVLNKKYKDTQLYITIKDNFKDLKKMSIYEVIERIITTFDYYNKLITIGNINEGLIKLDKLSEVAKNISDINYTLNDFIDYLNTLIEKGYDISYSTKLSSTDAVKIMTIHKSKGLEYHLCYFANLYKKFNIGDIKEKFIFDRKYGFIVPYFNEGITPSIYKSLLKEDYIKEEISEKIRLFYVAVTRCKEKMIMLLPNIADEVSSNKINYRSFRDILLSIKNVMEGYVKNINLDSISLSHDYDKVKSTSYKDIIPISKDILEIKQLDKEYKLVKEESYSKSVNKLLTNRELKNIDYGKYAHYLLEVSNFKEDNNEEIVKKLLSHEIFKNINNSKIYKEYEFIYDDDNTRKHGIIDLMIEYEDYIDIIDYKLNNIEDAGYNKQLLGYKKYITKKSGKKVNTYLYSILENKFKEVK